MSDCFSNISSVERYNRPSNLCSYNPCQNEGVCIRVQQNKDDLFRCLCLPGTVHMQHITTTYDIYGMYSVVLFCGSTIVSILRSINNY
jgi:hypothetical protein